VSKTPDFIEPFVGWKGLRAAPSGRLYSPQVSTGENDWPPGAPFEARCDRNHAHRPPVKRCTCGIYALKSFEDLKQHGYNWNSVAASEAGEELLMVVAEIKLWGRIRVGQIGYRAQSAYPHKVYVPATHLALKKAIRERYGCATGIIDRFSGRRI
jgi:hypothetical protein